MNYYTFTNAQSIVMRSRTAADEPQEQRWRWPRWFRRSGGSSSNSREEAPAAPWRRNRFLMLFSLSMGVCMCVPSAVALFVHHQKACPTDAAAAAEAVPDSPAQSGSIPDEATTADTPRTSDCSGSRFAGPALLLYLAFLTGLCISLSTLAAGLLCTPPAHDAAGCWAVLRRRVNAALCWDNSSSSPRAAPPSVVSEGASEYGDLGDSSREMRGLRVFTGVMVQLPHHDDAAGQAKSGSILVGVVDGGSLAATPAGSPRKPRPHLWEAFAQHSTPAPAAPPPAARTAAPPRASQLEQDPPAPPAGRPLVALSGPDARSAGCAAACRHGEAHGPEPSTQRAADAHADTTAVCSTAESVTSLSGEIPSTLVPAAGGGSSGVVCREDLCSHGQADVSARRPSGEAHDCCPQTAGANASPQVAGPRMTASRVGVTEGGWEEAGGPHAWPSGHARRRESPTGPWLRVGHAESSHLPPKVGTGSCSGDSAGNMHAHSSQSTDAEDSADLRWQTEASQVWHGGSCRQADLVGAAGDGM
eukprot:jgi/Ulvmu1/11458/UM077_0001.1